MIENRWIRRQTGDRQLVDVALQGYVVEDVAGDVVELETLAEIMERFGRVHGFTSQWNSVLFPAAWRNPWRGHR